MGKKKIEDRKLHFDWIDRGHSFDELKKMNPEKIVRQRDGNYERSKRYKSIGFIAAAIDMLAWAITKEPVVLVGAEFGLNMYLFGCWYNRSAKRLDEALVVATHDPGQVRFAKETMDKLMTQGYFASPEPEMV